MCQKREKLLAKKIFICPGWFYARHTTKKGLNFTTVETVFMPGDLCPDKISFNYP